MYNILYKQEKFMPIIWKKWQDPLAKVDDEDLVDSNYNKKIGPVIVGPLGIMPIDQAALVSATTTFWVGHANFHITGPIGKMIARVPGVETIRFLTPYRILVSFGEAFNAQKVMDVINSLFTAAPTHYEKAVDRVQVAKKMAHSKYKFWAVYKNEKGVINMYGNDKREEVFSHIKTEKGKGEPLQIFTSWG